MKKANSTLTTILYQHIPSISHIRAEIRTRPPTKPKVTALHVDYAATTIIKLTYVGSCPFLTHI
jgi:hypothetical protein